MSMFLSTPFLWGSSPENRSQIAEIILKRYKNTLTKSQNIYNQPLPLPFHNTLNKQPPYKPLKFLEAPLITKTKQCQKIQKHPTNQKTIQ